MAQEFDLLSTLTAPAPGLTQGLTQGFAQSPAQSSAPMEDPAAAAYSRLFSDAPPEQLDPDTMGLLTEAEGARLGTGWTRGTVRALNIYGETVPYEKLQELEGGRQLIDLAARAREGRRDFFEAVGTGSGTDFLPYVGDLASLGVSIRNMKTVRDGFKKMAKDGVSSLTLQEKVLMKMYEEDMRRQSEQTWGATVGSIVRQAPAFAAEFALTGGLFKAGSKALGMAGREAVEDVVVSGARRQAAKMAAEALKQPGMTSAGLELGKLAGFGEWLDDFVTAGVKGAGGQLDELGMAALKARGMKAAELAVAAKRNPSLIRDLGDFAVEYGKRGIFDHLDNVVRDMPPSVLGKLREAAGVAFIEAPVKGGLYAAFDFLAVNPLAAAVMGADEAVTETEVGIAMSGDEELMRNAKMLAFGTAWAEYASESSGRAFNALGGIVTDNIAGTVQRSVATRGLRATRDFKEGGSLARRMIDAYTGTADELQAKLAKLRRETVEMAATAPGDKLGGKTVNEFMVSDAAGVDQLVKERLRFQEKSFLGYYIASKALEKDITPQAVNKLLEAMGYDDILGEFMEERYNGFAQGLFGLDGTSSEHMGVMRRLAHAAQASTVDFKQGSAEIMAFALPVVGRATIAKAYTVLDAGKIGKFEAVRRAVSDLRSLGGWTHFADGADPVNTEIEMSDEGTGSALEIQRQKAGRDRLKQENAWKLESMDRAAQTLVDAIKDYGDIAEDRSGIGVKAARAALGIANAIITGNPLMAFNNPAKAVMLEGLGQEGVKLLQSVAGLRRSAYADELSLRAGASADAAGKALSESGAERNFDDPEIEAAIRPGLVATVRELIRIGLRSQGALVTTGADVDAHMAKVSEKEIAAAGGREAYRAAFEARLPEAAKRLRFDVQGDSAMLVYERALSTDDTVSAMDRQVESFLDQMGTASVADLTNADDPSSEFRAFAGVPMRESEMALAAGIGMDTRDPAARQSVRQARMRLALEIFRNPNFANELSRERLYERAGDYARLLVEVKRDLLRPQFDAPATDTPGLDGTRVEIKGSDGAYYPAYAASGRRVGVGSYATVDEAAAAAAGLPGFNRRDFEIAFTPSLASFVPYAAMLLSRSIPGMASYLRKASEADLRSHALNPFFNAALTHAEARRIVDAERALARRWQDRKSVPFATTEEEAAGEQAYRKVFGVAGRDGFVTQSGAEVDGYETAAARLAKVAGLDVRQNPARRGRSGYVLNPAGASYDGTVYIPYRYAGSTAALIEEGVEDALKRSDVRRGADVVSGLFRDPVRPSGYSPAARAFMTVVLEELQSHKASVADPDRRAEIAFLENVFDPANYEIEAVSHAVTAFYFMQGDAAVLGLGGGAAFYATLGSIARQVRAHRAEYDAFGQTVNRLLGGGALTPEGSRLRQAVGSFAPRRFHDDVGILRESDPGESPFTPLTDVGRMAEDLAMYVEAAKKGEIRATGKRRETQGTPEYAAETARYRTLLAGAQALARGGYFDEDLPALLDALATKNEKELADLGYEVAKMYSAGLDVAEATKAVRDAAVNRALDEGAPGVTQSWGEEVMVSDPAFALRLGTEFAGRKTAQAGDRRSVLRKIFDEFRSRDPLLSESLYGKFLQAVKDAGLYAEGEKAKDITGEVSKGAMTLDASFLEMPADTDDEDTGEGLEDADGDTDSRDDGGAYSEEAVKMLLEKSGPVQLLLNLMNFYGPGMNHHSPSVMRVFADASEFLYETNLSADPSDALMSVFDYSRWTERSGTSHPALLDAEAFEAWLGKSRPEDGRPMFDDLKDAFRALGVEGVFSAADKLKGSYGMDMMTAETQTDSDARAKSAKFTRRAQTLSGDISESLTQGAMKSTKEKAKEALSLLMAETPGKAGYEGRVERLARAADLMFGGNNAFSQALLHHPTRTRIEAAVSRLGTPQATKADVQTGKMFVENPGASYAKAGFVARQLAQAAELLSKGERDRAVLTLMRGDVLYKATLKNGAQGNWDRGGVTAELNAAAGGNAVGSSSRLDDVTRGAAKVRSLAAEQSVGYAEFLMSPEFEAAFKAAYAETKTAVPYKKLLARARRYAEWPDGTPVFSTFAGLTRKLEKASGEYDPYDDYSAPQESGDESFKAAGMSAFERVGQPTYEELSDIARLDYDAGKSAVATIPVYNSEKTMERLVRAPRAALAALAGKASPTFDEARKAISKLLLIEDVSAKRGFVWMSEGPSVTVPNAKLGLIVAEDPAARENFHGELFVTLSDLADYYRRQGFVATAKHIFTHAPGRASMTLASKGQMILADGKYEPGSRTAAFMDIARIGQELGLTALTDLDSYKEGPLAYKAADGRKAYELMLSGETDAEVKGPKGVMKVSEIMTAQGVTLENETINGGKVTIVSFAPGGVRSQWASAPGKKAKPVDSEMPVDKIMNNPAIQTFLNAQAKLRRAFAGRADVERDLKAKAIGKLPDAAKRLLEAGVSEYDPQIRAVLGPKLAAASAKAVKPTYRNIQAVAQNHDGARIIEKDGKPVLSDPFGGMKALPGGLIRDAYESEELGVRAAASTAANIGHGTARYGLRVIPAKLGVKDGDNAGIMRELERRVTALKAAERESQLKGDDGIFLAAYKELVADCFTDHNGNPLQPGQILSFSDLVDGDGKFDRSRVTHVSEGENKFTFLGGQLGLGSRTPADKGRRGEYFFSTAMPAYMEPADGSQTYRAISVQEDGTLSVETVPYPVGTLVAGSAAVIKITPWAKYLAGSDEDWDKLPFEMLTTDSLGRAAAPIDAEKAEAAIASATGADILRKIAAKFAKRLETARPEMRERIAAQRDEALAKAAADAPMREAQSILDGAVAGLQVKAFNAQVAFHRSLGYRPMTNPVSPTPLSKKAQDALPPYKSPALGDEGMATKAMQNKDAGKARGISTAVVASYKALIDNGIAFVKGLGNVSVLAKPEGAKSAFWARGFVVGSPVAWSGERLNAVVEVVEGIKNATFDDMKEALAYRAGFRPEFLDLHIALAFDCGVGSQDEYDQFHAAFLEWISGPHGAAVSKAFANARYPGRYGGAKYRAKIAAAAKSMDDAAKAEEKLGKGAAYRFRVVRELKPQQQAAVAAVIDAEMDKLGKGFEAAFDAAFPMASAFARLNSVQALGRVLMYKKASFSYPGQVTSAERVSEKVGALLETVGTDKARIQFRDAMGRRNMDEAVREFNAVVASARRASEGAVEMSELYAAASNYELTKAPKSLGDLKMDQRDAALRAANTLLPWEAAAMATPADTGAKIDAYLAAVNGKTPAFLGLVEALHVELFREYAKSLAKGGPSNAALDAILTPSLESKAKRITLTGTDGTAAGKAAMREGMLALLNGTSKLPAVSVKTPLVDAYAPRQTFEFTTADIYWMTLQYVALTAEKTMETGRSQQSLLDALFTPEVYETLSDWQVEQLKSSENAERLLNWVQAETSHPSSQGAVRREGDLVVPAAYENGPVAWGTLDVATRKAASENTKIEEGLEDMEEVPEFVRLMDTKAAEAMEIPALAAPVAVSTGFQGYKGGFENVGKGSAQGDGKDKAMRKVMTSAKIPGFIGEIATLGRASSTKTSLLEAASYGSGGNVTKTVPGSTHSSLPMFMGSGKYAPGEFKVMLARNGEFTGRPLAQTTVDSVKAAAKAGASFVVGDMPGVDSQFADLLQSIGAPFEVYHTGPAPRFAVVESKPAVSRPAEIRKQLQAYAKTVASAPAEARGLTKVSVHGRRYLAQATDATRKQAEAMGFALTRAAELPWMAAVPSAVESLKAASGILEDLGYAEPAVFLGALRAAGRAAVAASTKATEADVRLPDSYRGVMVTVAGSPLVNQRGKPGAARLVAPADAPPYIVIHKASIAALFNSRAWAVSSLPGVTPMRADLFKTVGSWVEYVLEHEYQHSLRPSVQYASGADKYAAEEDALNRMAVAALGLRDAYDAAPADAASMSDAIDSLRQILTDAGAAQSVDADRLVAAQKSGAELLEKPARQRVLEFAVISEPGFRGGADTAAIAQGLLKAIEAEGPVSDRTVPTFSLAEDTASAEKVASVERALAKLPKALRDRVSVVAKVPRFDGRQIDYAKKAWLQERGIDDPVMALWIERNEKAFGLKNWATKADVRGSIVDKLIKRTEALQATADTADREEWGGDTPDIGDVILRKAVDAWIESVPLSVDSPAERLGFLDLLMDIPEAGLTAGREDKYVDYPSKVAVEALWDYMHKFPNERFNVAKKYAALKNEKLLSSLETKPAASGKGTWAVVPRTERYKKDTEGLPDSLNPDFDMNVTKLRELSPPTWCTHDSHTETYVESYDNHVLMVNGRAVAGIELGAGASREFWPREIEALRELLGEDLPFGASDVRVDASNAVIGREGLTVGALFATTESRRELSYRFRGDDVDLISVGALTYVRDSDGRFDVQITEGQTAEQVRGLLERLTSALPPRKRLRDIHEVTSYANNGVATIDYLDDVLAYIRANGWNEDDEAGSIAKAKEYKAQGKTDADVANMIDGHWAGDVAGEAEARSEALNREIDRLAALFPGLVFPEGDSVRDFSLGNLRYRMAPDTVDAPSYDRARYEGEEYGADYVRLTAGEYEKALADYAATDEDTRARDQRAYYDVYPFSKGVQGVEGFYDPTADKAVLVAANIGTDARAREVALHETAHRGLHSLARAVGGGKELLKVLASAEAELMKAAPELVKKTGHRDLDALVRDYGFDPASAEGKLRLLSELTARWAERFGGQPQESWWAKLITAVRDWVRKFTGVTLDEKGVNELVKGVVRLGTQPREEAVTFSLAEADPPPSPDPRRSVDARIPVESMMGADDRRLAAIAVDSAVGYVPDRGDAMPEPTPAPADAVTFSLADSEAIQSDLGITDEELEAYAALPRSPGDLREDLEKRYKKYAAGAPAVTGGEFAAVAKATEDWKRDNGIVYDPNDAYSRGEGFYHDVGAFNPSAHGLVGNIAKVLLAQERKRRAGDLNYWEDTANQLVVSAYTSRAPQPPAYLYEVSLRSADYKTTWSKRLTEAELRELLAGRSDVDAVVKRVDEKSKDEYARGWESFSPNEVTVRLYGREATVTSARRVEDMAQIKTAPVRPGSGLRFVIRPSSQNILWAAKGDVYSGKVRQGASAISVASREDFLYGEYRYVGDEVHGYTRALIEDNEAVEDVDPEDYEAAWQNFKSDIEATKVDPKAPAASKLDLLSTSVADAIADRRPQKYNELGVRLQLGNFYIEGEVPRELRRLNDRLKKAFISVHGSLDPVAPYAPKAVARAAGEVTFSLGIPEMVDVVNRAEAEIMGLTKGDFELSDYAREWRRTHGPKGDVRKVFHKPESLAVLTPLFFRADKNALRGVADYLRQQIGVIENSRYLGQELKGALVRPLGLFFKPGSAYAELIALGKLPHSRGRQNADGTRGMSYRDLMKALGNMQEGAVAELKKSLELIERLSGPEREAADAEFLKAETAFLAAVHLARVSAVALRPRTELLDANGKPVLRDGRPVYIDNPLRAEMQALDNQNFEPPKDADPQPPPTPEEINALNPEHGHVDPWNDFNVTYTTSQAWFDSTVFPDFRGADVRGILFNKESAAAITRVISFTNAKEALWGVDSDTGALKIIERIKGMKGDDAVKYLRRTLPQEEADILAGRGFTDDEYDLVHYMTQAIHHYNGDGGERARIATAGDMRFSDLAWDTLRKMTPEEVRVFASYDEAARRRNSGGEAQVKAVHDLLLRAKEILPAALYPRAEAEVALALTAGRFAEDPAQAVLKDLESKGYAVARPETSATGAVRLTDAVLSVPVTLVDEVFQGTPEAPSSAKAKLLAAGRLESELTLRGNAAEFKREYGLLYKTFGSMGWLVNGDARMFTDIGTAAPSMVGTGSHRYHARKLQKAATPEYKARVAELYESLKRSSGSFSTREKTGAEAAADGRHNGMFLFLRQLRPATFSSASESAPEIWEVIRRGAAKDIGLDENSTGWDVAKAVYRLSVAKIHEVAWAGGTVESAAIDTAGLEAFNRLIGEQSEERGEGVMPGATFSDVYAVTGALQQNLTAGQALATHARQLAEAIRYRGAVNQMLMTPDENGQPLIVAKPGADDGDDTVPDRIWASVARWWAESYADKSGGGTYYDESKSGRDNARRLYDQIAPGKTAEGSEAETTRGARRYVWTEVEVPPGMPTFEAVSAAKDPAGDDTRARMNAHGGGEAANIARQIFAIAGYGREDTKNTKINHVLSWSKSASVMCSLFFPIATAFESPVAAVGMGSTLLGLTQTGAKFARWAQENNGWIAKALGVKDLEGAPFMADILRVIGSDDPALVQEKMTAQLAGISLADRSRNMLDTDRTLIAKDIKAASDRVRAVYGDKAAASVKALLEGAMEHSSEFAFEYVINATKIAVFSQMSARLRQKALAAGRWWDPVRDMRKWATEINVEVGGIDPAMYPWMTPAMQQWLRMAMFSWEWTLGAWEAGGGGVLTQKLFGRTTNAATRKFMFGRWARMYFGIMVGIPAAMQLLLTGLAKATGQGDDDDEWFIQANEKGKGHDFDITPLLRMMAAAPAVPAFGVIAGLAGLAVSPLAGLAASGAAAALTAAAGFAGGTVGDVKKALPESVLGLPAGALLPGATGQEGDMVSTRRRRYYMHLGKQGWEVAGWFENPARSFLSKMSMPAQKVLEGVLGITPSMGWDKDWKDLGFWERWTSLDPEKSALLNLTQAFVPFSVMGAQRSPEVGALSAIGPVGKGMSKTRAEKEMAAMFQEWGDAETFVARHKGRPGAYTDLASMATEWLEALRLNGYPPETSLKNALAAARKPLYERVHRALPFAPGMEADTVELEAAARGLYRLDFVGKSLLKSIKARDKNQNVRRVDELAKITDEALKSAFSDPYGQRTPEAARDRRDADRLKRSAALGGDVASILGNDKAPATVLGYRVMKTGELSADDLRFFDENPDSAGHFEKEIK